MKELIYHKRQDYNLCSIKSVESSYSDKRFFASLTSKLYEVASGSLHVEMGRPNYDVKSIIAEIDKTSYVKNFIKSKNFFEVSFDIPDNNCLDIEDILFDIWFAFQHCGFYFLQNSNVENLKKNKAWNSITNEQKSYVMFKGAEDDVVWIGKSADMSFADLMPPLPFEYRIV